MSLTAGILFHLQVNDAVSVNVLPPCRGCVAVIVTGLLTAFMQVPTP